MKFAFFLRETFFIALIQSLYFFASLAKTEKSFLPIIFFDAFFIISRFKGKSLEEANEIVAQRHRRPIPKVKIDQDAVNSYYTQKVAIADTKMSDYGKLMKMAALSKAQQKG